MRFLAVSALVLVLGLSDQAAALAFDTLQMDLAPGWGHRIDPNGAGEGSTVTIHDPAGVGELKLRTLVVPAPISPEALRQLTNVPMTEPLNVQRWGDFSGYQHDYSEGGAFYRTWWLARDNRLVFATYQCDTADAGTETGSIDWMMRSLSAN